MTIKIFTNGIEQDINLEFAKRAFYAVSFSPEKRGQAVYESYVESLQNFAKFIEANTTDQEAGQAVFDRLREGYKKRVNAWLSAKSRCMSSMITGPANFPVRRAEKANASEHKRSVEMLDYYDKMQKYALKVLKPVSKRKTDKENKTHSFKGFEVLENYDEDRLQIIFEDKPSEEIRVLLKSKAFKWSPRFGAWQRQLTDNARIAFKRIKDNLEAMEA